MLPQGFKEKLFKMLCNKKLFNLKLEMTSTQETRQLKMIVESFRLGIEKLCILTPVVPSFSKPYIRKTCPCNVYPLIPLFCIAKLGYAGVYLFFLFLLQNIDCGYSLEPPRL